MKNYLLILLHLAVVSLSSQEIVPITQLEVTPLGTAALTFASDTDSYYLLYHKQESEVRFTRAIAISMGEADNMTMHDNLTADTQENYQVLRYAIANPGDIDNDGIDDVTEIEEYNNHAPLNPAPPIDFVNGVRTIPDTMMLNDLSFNRNIDVLGQRLTNLQTVKFYLLDAQNTYPQLYFLNANTHLAHWEFAQVVPIPDITNSKHYRGQVAWHPDILSNNGTEGMYRFRFQPTDAYSFEEIQTIQELLAAHLPFIQNNLCYYPMPAALPTVESEMALYDDSRVCLLYESDLYADIDYLPLNIKEGYGLLRNLEPNEEPNAREVIIMESLPNELSRVAGIITTVPQTPLSHVNLRAIQDQVPNAFIRFALETDSVQSLIGKYVHYKVAADKYELTETTKAVVDAHFESLRPENEQTPPRDLSEQSILPLDDIEFSDSESFGVKCSNVATMRNFGFPMGTIPKGYGIPFYFYDEFMKHNGFYAEVAELLNDPEFNNDIEVQKDELKDLRSDIKDAELPVWMYDELTILQESFPPGTSIRCRSSSNNEDLPGFSGAGLYDSKTQHPDEGHISKSVKQVFASTWNFRAFDEREFYRIDHLATAMGILCHPNYSDEKVNGVAVSSDPLHDTEGTYYVNSQQGEDLVTNPNEFSIPEELLLVVDTSQGSPYILLRPSSLNDGDLLLSENQFDELREYLTVIHEEFEKLYEAEGKANFAMEIEYKITAQNQLIIKQARPWAGFWKTNSVVENEASRKNYLIYPNPVKESLTIKLERDSGSQFSVVIYDIKGRIVRRPMQFITDIDKEIRLDIARMQLESGLYHIHLSSRSGADRTVIHVVIF